MLWHILATLFLFPVHTLTNESTENSTKICEVDDLVEYAIKQRLPISETLFDGCDGTLSLSGTNGNIGGILLCGKNGKFKTNIKHVGVDIGDIKYIVLDKGDSYAYECLEIEINKNNRFWRFNCTEQFHNGKAKLYPEGNKPYIIELKTGSQIGAGTEGNVRIKLIGENGQTGSIYLTNHLKRGSVNIYHIKASDVGELKSIVVSNDSTDLPWYCVSVSVLFNDRRVPFGINRWLGGTYNNNALVSLNDNSFVHEITCSTRLVDIFLGMPTDKLHSFAVKCPLNCPKEKVEGFIIHPGSTSICSAAIVDGIISYGGGEVNVTVGPQLPRYNAGIGTRNSIDYEPFNRTSSFYLYKIDSIDDIDSKIRLVDGRGELASVGRLEIFDENAGHWGTVCGSGKGTKFTSKAAHLVCHHLGFETGERVYTGCKDVYGEYMCAHRGYPVAIAGLGCLGNERSITQCPFENPTVDCLNHENDVVIHCRKQISSFGDVKLVNYADHVTNNGNIGRLEINVGGYRPICSDKWSLKEAIIACNQLGYANVDGEGCVNCYCEETNGHNYCSKWGSDNLIKISCKGYEQRLSECKIEGAEEHECNGEVVLSCAEKELSKMDIERLQFPSNPLKPILKLSCYDTADDVEFDKDGIRVVDCPLGCKNTKSLVEGTLIYSVKSSICKAAIHSGVVDDGGNLVIRVASGVKRVFGTSRNGIVSIEGIEVEKGFTLSSVVSKLLDKVRIGVNPESRSGGTYASNSTEIDKAVDEIGDKQDNDIENENKNKGIDGSLSVPSHNERLKPLYNITPKLAFTGTSNSWLDITNYEFWSKIASSNKFSISIHFKPATNGIDGSRKTLLSLGNCGGLILSLDDRQLVVEQICHAAITITSVINTSDDDTSIDNEVVHILLTYHGPSKTIAVYSNGHNTIHKSNWSTISLTGPKYVGRPGTMYDDYFVGQIYNIQFFDHILTSQDAYSLIKNFNSTVINTFTVVDDGKIHCLKHPIKYNLTSRWDDSFKSLVLGCDDDLRVINGFVGQTFSVYCGDDCSDIKLPLKGSGIYSPDSSICKAAMHAGAGNHVLLKLLDGLPSYKSTKGHHGIISCSEYSPQLISFSVSPMVTSEYLTCEDDAMWILKLPIGSKHIVMCPKDCQNNKKAKVFGTDIYSPNSSVCKAALHSKDIKGNMRIEVEVAEGLSDYKGSERNGVTSYSYKGYLRSFKIISVDKC